MNFFFKLKTNFLVDAIILVVLGLVLIFMPGVTLELLTKFIGGLVLFAGAVAVLSGILSKKQNVLEKNSSLTVGLIISVIGAWILINPHFFVSIIPVIAGVIILFSGLTNLGQTISLGKNKYGNWWIALILAIGTIAAGVFLVFKPFLAAAYLVRIIGAALVYNGVSNLWIISRMNKVEKVNGQIVVDVESKDVTPENKQEVIDVDSNK